MSYFVVSYPAAVLESTPKFAVIRYVMFVTRAHRAKVVTIICYNFSGNIYCAHEKYFRLDLAEHVRARVRSAS